MIPTFEALPRALSEAIPDAADPTGPIARRTHLDVPGVALAVDLIVCRPLEWVNFPGRERGGWSVETAGDRVVAWRAVRAIESPIPPVPRKRDHDGPAPPGELATWPLVDRHARHVATRVVMARVAWEALPVPDRPGGHWSEDGKHLCYDRPA